MDYLEARWSKLWYDLGAPVPRGSFEKVVMAYDEPHRQYHTMLHIANSLEMLDWHRSLAHDPLSLEIAIWLHDIIYDVRSSDNESRSALFAKEMLVSAGLHSRAHDVFDLIESTANHEGELKGDFALLSDIDLSILGARSDIYTQYAKDIRDEYAWVPESVYCQGRIKILNSMLSRGAIFFKPAFYDQYENRATSNIMDEIALLKQKV